MYAYAPIALSLALLGSGQPPPAVPPRAVTHELLDARVMAGESIPRGPMVYLVAPSGHVFRVLGQQPILDQDGTKLGMLVSYVGDTRDPAAATAESAELMEAFGLDMQVSGVTAVLVQARVGFDARKTFNASIGFHTSYLLREGRWVAQPTLPCAPSAPCARRSIGEGPLEVVDDPDFSFDRAGLGDAATVARRYSQAAEALDLDRMRAELSPISLAKVDTQPDAWKRQMDSYAQVRKRAPRRDQFQLLFREPGSGSVGARIAFALDLGVPGKRALENVILRREPDRWRVIAYSFYYPNEANAPHERP